MKSKNRFSPNLNILLGFLLGGLVLSLCFGVGASSIVRAQEVPTPVTNDYYTVTLETLSNGTTIEENIINGPSSPPSGFEIERQSVLLEKDFSSANVHILTTPAFNWVFGCSAVSGAMIAGYYDRVGWPNIYTGPTNGGIIPLDNSSWPTWSDGYTSYPSCPLIASKNGVDGRTTFGSIDNYWVSYNSNASDPYITNGWVQHSWGSAIGDYMKTSQSAFNNTDGSTAFYHYTDLAVPLTCAVMASYSLPDGTLGRKLFYEARGYVVTDCYNQKTDNIITGGFSFSQFKAEIDAGRPVMLNLAGHTIVGVGYDDSSNLVYLHDTWDYLTHTMTWGGSYAGMSLQSVSIVNLQGTISPPSFTITGNAGVGGAILSYTDGAPKTATADGSGLYSFEVPSGWSGTVTPTKSGYTFAPVNKNYVNVLANQTNQNYVAAIDTPPSVLSILRVNENPTALKSVCFSILFSEAVINVDKGDFTLNTSGISGATISEVSGTGTTYTVTVNTGTGDGSISLEIVTTDIADLTGNSLGGLPFTGSETYITVSRPDLIITNVTLIPEVPTPDQTFEVSVTITNQGKAAATGDVYRDIYIDRDPAADLISSTGCTSVGEFSRSDYYASFDPGMSDTKIITITDGLPSGVHQIFAYVDARCLIDEK